MPVSPSPRPDAPAKPKKPRAKKPGAAKRREDEALERVEQHLSRGELDPAAAALLLELDRRGDTGDHACALTARLLRARDRAKPASPAAADALATALDRLVRLVQRQEEEIHALRALVEEGL